MTKGDLNDPKGLIYESYRIPDISPPECRSIFLDWALSLLMIGWMTWLTPVACQYVTNCTPQMPYRP